MTEDVKEALAELAGLAKTGVRFLVLVGKVTDQKRYAANEYGAARVVCPCVASEGSSLNLTFADGETVPGRGFEGAFLVDPASVYKGKSGTSVDCLTFA